MENSTALQTPTQAFIQALNDLRETMKKLSFNLIIELLTQSSDNIKKPKESVGWSTLKTCCKLKHQNSESFKGIARPLGPLTAFSTR